MANGKPDCSETSKLHKAYLEVPDKLTVSINEVNKKDKATIESHYNKVIKNIVFQENDFSEKEKNSIKNAIKNLYFGAPSSREIFDKIGNLKKGEGDKSFGGFYIMTGTYDSPNPYDSTNSSEPGGYSIMIDVKGHSHCNSIHAFNDKDGDFILMSLERSIMHETIHAVTGLTDEDYKTTHAPTGKVVDWTNDIMRELNVQDRPTYEVDPRLKDDENQER